MTANPLITLQRDPQPVRHIKRETISFQKRQPEKAQTPVICTKTKAAICFLCLFNGLRTPSIRRLSRRPRSISDKPILTFDPAVFAPSSINALKETYLEAVHCQSTIVVDPASKVVTELICNHNTGPPERLILHYCGQGANPPTPDGSISFFSDNRDKYRLLKVDRIFQCYSSPLCVIMDCPSAANVKACFEVKPDLIGFYACAGNEQLPISTDAPCDLFSRCLLAPFETALWWHTRRHSCVFNYTKPEEPNPFLKPFLFALLETIAFDTQEPAVFDTFTKDPAMLSLLRGYILAQRIMQSFNIHPSSTPNLKPTNKHDLWLFWDTSIDSAESMPADQASEMIFGLFMQSFKSFPSPGMMPLFAFFISRPETRGEAIRALFAFLDSHQEAVEACARSNVPQAIIDLKSPSESALLLLAKMLPFRSGPSPFYQQWQFWFQGKEASPSETRAGFLAITCAIAQSFSSSFVKIGNACVERAESCLPYSLILLGALTERAGRMLNLLNPPRYRPMLSSEREEVRAAAAFLLGIAKDVESVPALVDLTKDSNSLVRGQAVVALAAVFAKFSEPRAFEALNEAKNDSDPKVREAAALGALKKAEAAREKLDLVQMVIENVKENGFDRRYKADIICLIR